MFAQILLTQIMNRPAPPTDVGASFPQLTFSIDNAGFPGRIYVSNNPNQNQLSLTIGSNAPARFISGPVVPPDKAADARQTLIYVDLKPLGLSDAEMAGIQPSGQGWDHAIYTDIRTVALAPTNDFSIAAGSTISIALKNFVMANMPTANPVYLASTYYNVPDIAIPPLPMVYKFAESILLPPDGKKDLQDAIQASMSQSIVVTSTDTYPNVANTLKLTLSPGSRWTQITADNNTTFVLTFVYDSAPPGYGALTTPESVVANDTKVTNVGNNWVITFNPNLQTPSWQMVPPAGQVIIGPNGTIEFDITKVVTDFAPGPTLMIVTYSNVPGYADGSYRLVLNKVAHAEITSFTVTPPTSHLQQGQAMVTLNWLVKDAGTLTLAPMGVDVTGQTSYTAVITETTQFTLTAQGTAAANLGNVAYANVTATVLPVFNSFTAGPSTVYASSYPSLVQLDWNVDTNQLLTLTSSVTGPDANYYQPVGSVGKMLARPQMFTLSPRNPSNPTQRRNVIVPAFSVASRSYAGQSARCVAAAPWASFIATGQGDTVNIYGTANFQVVTTVKVPGVTGLAFSRDGRLMAASSSQGSVAIFAVATTGSTPAWTFTPLVSVSLGASAQALAFHDNDTIFAVASAPGNAGMLALIRRVSGSFVNSSSVTVGKGAANLAVSPSGAQIFVSNTTDNTLAVVGVAGGSLQLAGSAVDLPGAGSVAVTPDGTLVLVACSDGTVQSLSTSAPFTSSRKRYAVGTGSSWIGIMASGTYVFAANAGSGNVSIIDLSQASVSSTGVSAAGPVAVTRDAALVLIGGASALTVLSLNRYLGSTTQPASPGTPSNVTLLPDGRRIAAWYNAMVKHPGMPMTGICVYDTNTLTTANFLSGTNLSAAVASPIAADATIYLAQKGQPSVIAVETTAFSTTMTLRIPDKTGFPNRQPVNLAISGDGRTLFVLVSDGSRQYSLVAFSVAPASGTATLLSDVVAYTARVVVLLAPIAASPDGATAYLLDSSTSTLLRATRQHNGEYWPTGKTLTLATGSSLGMVLSPDGAVLYAGMSAGMTTTFSVVDTEKWVATNTQLSEDASTMSLNSFTILPDGSQLLATDSLYSGVRVIDAASLRFVQTISWQSGVANPSGIVATADGSCIVTANLSSANLAVAPQVQPN